MPKYSVKRRSPYTPQQLFAIAADIGAYSDFVPLLRQVVITNRHEINGVTELDSELVIVYKKLGINESLRSHVTLDPRNLVIRSTANTPPVRHLNGIWQFHPLADGGCEVDYSVDYKLVSKPMQFLLSGMFDWAVRKLLTAFENRALELYGRPVVRAM